MGDQQHVLAGMLLMQAPDRSQHTLGKAMDFYIPGVPLAKIREAGLRLQRGGVGRVHTESADVSGATRALPFFLPPLPLSSWPPLPKPMWQRR